MIGFLDANFKTIFVCGLQIAIYNFLQKYVRNNKYKGIILYFFLYKSAVYKFGVFKIFVVVVVVVFELLFLYDNKAEFSASLLQSQCHMIPLKTILISSFAAQKNVLSSVFKTVVLLNIIVEILNIYF